MGDFLKRSNFFTDESKIMVLTCLRLETRSNIFYFWSFTIHAFSSSNFILRPWCTSSLFYCKRARYSAHLNDSSKGDVLKRSNFFIDVTKKLVLTCLRLETRSNIFYFWSLTMHSLSSWIFFCGPGTFLLQFSLREQDILFFTMIHPWGIFWKETIFSQMRPKNWF